MRLTRIGADQALSFRSLSCPLNKTLTLVTGPNAVGKTSLGRIVEIIIDGLAVISSSNITPLTAAHGRSGRYGARAWSVELDVELDFDELGLIDHWVRLSLLRLVAGSQTPENLSQQQLLDQTNELGTAAVFSRGTIRLEYDDRRLNPWVMSWNSQAQALRRTARPFPVPITAEPARPTSASEAAIGNNVEARDSQDLASPAIGAAAATDPAPGTQITAVGSGSASASAAMILEFDTNILRVDGVGGIAQIDSALKNYILDEQGHTGDGAVGGDVPMPPQAQFPDLVTFARIGPIGLGASIANNPPFSGHPSAQALIDKLGIDRARATQHVGFAQLLLELLRSTALVTSNHRLPARTVYDPDLLPTPDIGSGVDLALRLFLDKNGDTAARRRFAVSQQNFQQLSGTKTRLDVIAEIVHDTDIAGPAGHVGTQSPGAQLMLTAVVNDAQGDIPLELSGAGRQEAAWLAAVLAHDSPCLILDEPATNLSASAQHLLAAVVANRTATKRQTILITHSGHLIPANSVDDLTPVIRLTHAGDHTVVHRISDSPPAGRDMRMLQPVEVRDALFSNGALLVEGPTERELLRVWLRQTAPTVSEANIAVLSIDTETALVPHINLLSTLGIPWTAFVDGPALAPGHGLAKSVEHAPSEFDEAKCFWAERGVFTLATAFGVGDEKGAGEIEIWMERIAPEAWQEANEAARRSSDGEPRPVSKPYRATLFAQRVPVPPDVERLWVSVQAHLLNGSRGQATTGRTNTATASEHCD